MLKQRLVTALILILLLLFVVFFTSPIQFDSVLFLLGLFAAWEWTRLMTLYDFSTRLFYVAIVGLVTLKMLLMPIHIVLGWALLWWAVATVLVVRYAMGRAIVAHNFVIKGVMGLFVLVPCLVALCYIREVADGRLWLLGLFALVSGADSAAYFVGRQFGKTLLASRVSPKKSIQGVLGALVFATGFTAIFLWLLSVPYRCYVFAIGAVSLTVLLSVVGDLFESLLKREVGLKDSGHFLPGHGGLLDRIDSLTAAAPFYAFAVWAAHRYMLI